jgi:peptidoglycan/xylan/chitin deacetylase (PgdA/CDA1 family)
MAVSLPGFVSLLEFISRHAQVVSLEQLVNAPAYESGDRVRVVLTFDDGYRDNYDNAFPELVRRRMPATIFVATQSVDQPDAHMWWDEIDFLVDRLTSENKDGLAQVLQSIDVLWKPEEPHCTLKNRIVDTLRELPTRERNDRVARLSSHNAGGRTRARDRLMLSWGEAREMSARGIAIGAHSVTHASLDELDGAELRNEIVACRDRIHQEIGRMPHLFAYPSGRFSRATKNAVQKAGFKIACTTKSGIYNTDCDPLEIPRIDVTDDMVSGIQRSFSENMCWYQMLRRLA